MDNAGRNESVDSLIGTIPEDIVERHAADRGIDFAEASEHFAEMVRFLVAAKELRCQLIPSLEVDEAWHSFILNTEAYSEWCARYLGAFAHHRPLPRQSDSALVAAAFQESVSALRRFGINDKHWQYGAWSVFSGR